MSNYEKLCAATAQLQQDLLHIPFVSVGIEGKWSLLQYLAFLQEAYHHVRHTTPLLMACGSRLPPQQEWLRDAMAEYIEEELGHQRWILEDITQAGGDAAAAAAARPSVSCELMVAYAYDMVHRVDPLGFLGMVHVLEGTSVRAATQAAEKLQLSLGLGKNCFSYLSSHGSLDLSHVDFFKGLVNRLDPEKELPQVIHSARVFFKLYGDIFRELGREHSL